MQKYIIIATLILSVFIGNCMAMDNKPNKINNKDYENKKIQKDVIRILNQNSPIKAKVNKDTINDNHEKN